MNFISAILVPLNGSEIARCSLGCAAWLASRLGARLHILYSGEPLPAEQALDHLGVAQQYRPLVELHQTRGEPTADILAAIERLRIGLIVMTARGQSAADMTGSPFEPVGHVARAVIEQSPVPVLVLPRAYEEAVPWRSALVPVSGEVETDQSLMLALQLAKALDLDVTVAHVVQDAQAGKGGLRYMDEAHHEYPQMLNELISRACPLCGPAERGRISDFRLYRGDVARELLDLIEQKHMDAVIVGWHGFFEAGHAHVLKALLQGLRRPVLLVKPRPKEPFRLKVGDALA
ncbi:MAG TPA: universal stress protein [Steroidobacteraceae bacterium]|nr:universal stress protein [Steroidobacteraceae bacterium]